MLGKKTNIIYRRSSLFAVIQFPVLAIHTKKRAKKQIRRRRAYFLPYLGLQFLVWAVSKFLSNVIPAQVTRKTCTKTAQLIGSHIKHVSSVITIDIRSAHFMFTYRKKRVKFFIDDFANARMFFGHIHVLNYTKVVKT